MAMCHRRRVCGAPALIRPDLADRAVFLTLEAIPEERQQPEQELGIKFEGERAVILGALLDAVVRCRLIACPQGGFRPMVHRLRGRDLDGGNLPDLILRQSG
jgi:hypothetical protein